MTEENKRLFDRAYDAVKEIETVACYLLGDFGYWGENGRPDADNLAMAERHLACLRMAADELEQALVSMRRVTYADDVVEEVTHVD